jgi:hypothetical protein
VVAKPFAAGFKGESEGSLWALDFLTNTTDTDTSFFSFHRSIEKIAMNPSRCAELFNLYGGDSYPPSPKVPLSSEEPLSDNPLQFPMDIDTERIYAVGAYNRFGFSGTSKLASFDLIKPTEDKLRRHSSGLYLFPSYFNHSCIPNADRSNFGDVMVIRAVRNIPKGDEIFLSYIGTLAGYEGRKKVLTKWIPKCDCELCDRDREAGATKIKKREQLCKQAFSGSVPIDRLRQITNQIDNTYVASHDPYRLESSHCHHRLALALEHQKSITHASIVEAIQEEMKALDNLGILVIDRKMTSSRPKKESERRLPIATDRAPYSPLEPVMTALTIVSLFRTLDIHWRAESWMRAALWRKLYFYT